MCKCCSCTPLGQCLGNLNYVVERISSCAAATAGVTCVMLTILIMTGLGVGVGYNYCFVEMRLNATLEEAKALREIERTSPSLLPRVSYETRLKHTTSRRFLKGNEEFGPRPYSNRSRRSRDEFPEPELKQMVTPVTLEIKPTMVVPLHHLNLIELMQKLQKSNNNYTLELVGGL